MPILIKEVWGWLKLWYGEIDLNGEVFTWNDGEGFAAEYPIYKLADFLQNGPIVSLGEEFVGEEACNLVKLEDGKDIELLSVPEANAWYAKYMEHFNARFRNED